MLEMDHLGLLVVTRRIKKPCVSRILLVQNRRRNCPQIRMYSVFTANVCRREQPDIMYFIRIYLRSTEDIAFIL